MELAEARSVLLVHDVILPSAGAVQHSRAMPAALRLFFVLLLPLAGCGGDRIPTAPGSDAGVPGGDAGIGSDAGNGGPCSPDDPRTEAPEPFIGYAGLRDRLVAAFDGATVSLDVATYIFDDPPLISALERAHARGVDVRALVDEMRTENAATIERLRAAGVAARESPATFEHFHPKYAVIDGAYAIVMSANLNGYSMESERNHGVVLRDPRDVADLAEVFAQDYDGVPPDLECTRLVLSPNNSRERIEGLVASALTELRIQQLSLTDRDVRAAIAARAAAGVRVRVILADPAWIETNAESAQILRDGGADVRFLYVPENHAKLIVADETAFVGSENLSWTSLERNREVGVLASEPATTAPLIEAFEADWSRSTP